MPNIQNVLRKPSEGAGRFAMSVDVEDYFQVWALSGVIRRDAWEQYSRRVKDATSRVLDLLDRHDATATFFILGWIAEREGRLVREIAERGHEVASHGYDHRKVFEQTPAEFRDDVAKTKRILEDLGGCGVRGFRAAGFSIDQRTPWAYEILAETGHSYSSSSHPIAHDHYGDRDAPRTPYNRGGVLEAPVATAQYFGRRLPCGGGGWFRASPYLASSFFIRDAAKTLDGPVIFYFHPWEIDPEQPRVGGLSVRSRARHYLNLGGMEKKLGRLMSDFEWRRIDETLAAFDLQRVAS